MLGHVSERQRGQLGDIAAAQNDEVLGGMVAAAQREQLWGVVLPVVPRARRGTISSASAIAPSSACD